jgi:hypothetical protein
LTVKFLLSYSTRPLQIFGLVGIVLGGLGTLLLAVLGYSRLAGWMSLDQHQPLLLFGILLGFAGLQLLTIGLLAEMQVRTYHESQGKPIYAVRRLIEQPLRSDVARLSVSEPTLSRAVSRRE